MKRRLRSGTQAVKLREFRPIGLSQRKTGCNKDQRVDESCVKMKVRIMMIEWMDKERDRRIRRKEKVKWGVGRGEIDTRKGFQDQVLV